MRTKCNFICAQFTWIVSSYLIGVVGALLLNEPSSEHQTINSHFDNQWENQNFKSRVKRSNGNTSDLTEYETYFLSCNDTNANVQNTSGFVPTCGEIHNVEYISSSYSISDPDLLRILRHELLFCRSKDICGLHGHYSGGQPNCCYFHDECSCSKDCKLGGNCCVGSVNSFEELWKANSGKSCYTPQLFFNHANLANRMVYMMDTCNDTSTDHDTVDKCIKRPDIYFDHDPFIFIPVYSKRDLFTVYKNKYCALCNSHKEDDLVFWKIDVGCEIQKEHFVFKTLNDLFQLVRDDSHYCNIRYEQPDGFANLSPCQKADVETCPDDPKIDPFYSKACKAYTSIYAPFTDASITYRTYKNVFCYLCNGNSLKDSPNKCRHPDVPIFPGVIEKTVPFTILLDFNSLVSRPTGPSSTRCSESQRYDTFTNECRDIFCSNDLVLQNESCISPLEKESRRSYSIRYQLYNKTAVPFGDTPDQSHLMNFYKDGVLFEIIKLFRILKLDENICRSVISYVYESDMSSNETSQPEYIAIDFDIELPEIHSFSNIIKALLSPSGISIPVKSVNGSIVYEIRVSNSSIASSSFMAPPSSKIPSNLIARSKIVIDNFEYIFDNDTRHPRCDIQPVRHFAVTQFALCPKISLPIPSVTRLKEGSVCIEKRGCYRAGSFQTIDDKLILCADDYFRNLPNDEEIQYSEIQSVLSIVCTSLSVLCLVMTLVTYAIFSTLRKLPGMNNMALISTLICAQLLYQFGINRNESSIVCGILGIAIHFTWLASICWMNVCTYHMFHTFVWDMMRPSMRDELSRNKYLLFYALYSYLLPVIFISANVITSLVNSDFKNYGYGPDICYISSSTLIAYTFAVPVGILLLINLILFLVVIYKIQRAPKMKAVNHNPRRNFLVFIKLSCITGLFWLIGFLFQWLKFAALGYVFIILNASQGVFIMFAFVCNKRILDLYKKRFADKDVGKTSTNSHETNFSNLTKTNTN